MSVRRGCMDSRARTVGKVVAIFVILGVGLGTAGFIVLDQFAPSGDGVGAALVQGLLVLQAVVFIYLLGPAMGVVSGLYTGRQESDPVDSATTGGAAAFAGFYLMFLLAFLVMSLAFPETSGDGGSGSTDLGNNLVQMVLVGIPTGGVGALTGYLTNGDA